VFDALLLRESVELTEELIDCLRADPAEIRPHRFLRASFLGSARRPVIMAMLSGNSELFGVLRQRDSYNRVLPAVEHWLALMLRRRLLRTDFLPAYTIHAASTGFYLDLTTDQRAKMSIEARADALAHVVGTAFEPTAEAEPLALAAAAAELVILLGEFSARDRKAIYPTIGGRTENHPAVSR
jgi:hypothetical protein